MTLGAHVGSLESIQRLRAAVQEFIVTADKALCEASIEVDRTADWINHDRQAHWNSEARRRHEAVVKAQDEVRRAQWTIGEHKPAAIEQKKALKKAEARLAEAKEKLANVARWKREFAQAANEYKGQTQHLASALDADLPRAAGTLDLVLLTIEEYLAVPAPLGGAEDIAGAAGRDDGAERVARRRPLDDPKEKAALVASLRRRAAETARDQVTVSRGLASDAAWESPPASVQLPDSVRERLVPCRPGDLVVLEHHVLAVADDGLFFVRLGACAAGDSGWHIGHITEQRSEDLIATTVSRLNLLRPDWAEMLAAAPGTMLLLRKGELDVLSESESEFMT